MLRTLHTIILAAVVIAAAASSSICSAASDDSDRPSVDPDDEALVATPLASTATCGVERWSVKTGSDTDVASVAPTLVPTTIAQLRALPAPSTLPSNSRVQPTETTTFVIDATLTLYKLETDSDYHLVIKDSAGNTMIAEIPDPACVAVSSPFAAAIAVVRQTLDAKYAASTTFQSANIPVRVVGVGFFDFLHGQTGVAPNGIELHPVLGLIVDRIFADQFDGGS